MVHRLEKINKINFEKLGKREKLRLTKIVSLQIAAEQITREQTIKIQLPKKRAKEVATWFCLMCFLTLVGHTT